MVHLFSPLRIARAALPNRIAMGPLPSGHASSDGFIDDALISYYAQRAIGGVGLIITEAARVSRPEPEQTRAHIGLYDDAFVPQLRRLVRAVHSAGACLVITLDEPATAASGSINTLQVLAEDFIQAAWRALAAGCDGVMLSSADGGVLHALVSPLLNQRFDAYGGNIDGRLRLPQEIIEGINAWLGRRLFVGFRLIAEEFTAGGMSLHDARVVAKRVVAAGVKLLDVTVDVQTATPIARFPGWCVPLANSIKRIIPDVPVICSGSLGDPQLADSVVRDGSVDIVMLGRSLRSNPDWPRIARAALAPTLNGTLAYDEFPAATEIEES